MVFKKKKKRLKKAVKAKKHAKKAVKVKKHAKKAVKVKKHAKKVVKSKKKASTKAKSSKKRAKVSATSKRSVHVSRKRPKKTIPKSRKAKTAHKKKPVRAKSQELPPKVHIVEPGQHVKSGLDEDFIFNSSHANGLETSIEGNLPQVFNRAFNGYLSKGPFEAEDIPIYGYGVTFRARQFHLGEIGLKEIGAKIHGLLFEFPEAVVNVSDSTLRVFFPQRKGVSNEQVIDLMRDRAEVLEEIYQYMRQTTDSNVDWWANWFTEDAMYEG